MRGPHPQSRSLWIFAVVVLGGLLVGLWLLQGSHESPPNPVAPGLSSERQGGDSRAQQRAAGRISALRPTVGAQEQTTGPVGSTPAELAPQAPEDGAQAGPLVAQGQVMAYATDIQMSKRGSLVTVTARIWASNGGLSPVTGLVVTGADGQTVYVGDIPPKGEAVSAPYYFSVDVSGYPSRSLLLPVALRFSNQGEPVEVQSGLTLFLPE